MSFCGMNVNVSAVAVGVALIVILRGVKLITKTFGVWPLPRFSGSASARTDRRDQG